MNHNVRAMNAFEDLKIWQIARQLCDEVFQLYKSSDLQYDKVLWNQMNKSSGSIMDNIAEGFERNGNREFRQFLSVAKASCGELRSQCYRCHDRAYLDESQFKELRGKLVRQSQMISHLLKHVSHSEMKGAKFIPISPGPDEIS